MKNKTKKRSTQEDYVIANRRASRQEEIEAHGRPVSCRNFVHKSKKSYSRKKLGQISLDD